MKFRKLKFGRPLASAEGEHARVVEQEFLYRNFAIIGSELIESKWNEYLLLNQRVTAPKTTLLISGDTRTMVMNIPYQLKDSING